MAKIPGIAMRSGGAVMILDTNAIKSVSDTPKEFQQTIPSETTASWKWSPWGANNLFPQELVKDIETCGILNSIIDGKARFALCEGMTPAIVKRDQDGKRVVEKYVDDPEITEFLETNDAFFNTAGWMRDQIGIGNGVARFLLNKKRDRIDQFRRHDITEMRYEKKDPKTGKINNVWFSANWAYNSGSAGTGITIPPFAVPLLDPHNPVQNLRDRAGRSNEFALTFRYPAWGKHYYSTPLWYAAYKWVKIAQGVPEMKAAMFNNTMVLKYMVIINESYWTNRFGDEWETLREDEQEQRRDEVYNEIDQFLVGAENAHKSIFVNGHRDPINGNTWQDIEVKKIESTTPTGDYLPEAATANSEIAFAMMFNPAIIGASMPSGPYTNSQGGSNVRESVLLQIILHELERRNIARVMNVIKYFNGWDKRHPGLEFVIPATVLTTLDTGGSSKPVTLGAGSPDKQPNPSTQNPTT